MRHISPKIALNNDDLPEPTWIVYVSKKKEEQSTGLSGNRISHSVIIRSQNLKKNVHLLIIFGLPMC